MASSAGNTNVKENHKFLFGFLITTYVACNTDFARRTASRGLKLASRTRQAARARTAAILAARTCRAVTIGCRAWRLRFKRPRCACRNRQTVRGPSL